MLYAGVLSFVVLIALLAWLLTLRKSNPFHLVQRLMDEGNYDEAVLKLTAISEDVDLAPRSYIYLAECHEQLGARDLARTCYRKAIDSGAFDDKDREVEIFKKIGEIYRSEGDTEGFFETCLEILRLNPTDELANQEVGMIALGDGHFSIAETYLKAAMQNSDDPQLTLAFAVTEWQLGEKETAMSIMEKLLAEGDGFQDWEAQHVSIETVHRRVRIYTVATASSPEIRAARARSARREFEVNVDPTRVRTELLRPCHVHRPACLVELRRAVKPLGHQLLHPRQAGAGGLQ